jgi:enamine deaminase RidA (YjgF/YER057c/UK114 family)
MTHRKERQLVSSGSPYEEPIGFSRAVRVGDRVIVAGTAPNWPDGHVDPDVEAQTDRCIEIMLAALAEAGASAAEVVRTRTYLVNGGDWEAAGRSHGRYFRDARPASTMVVVTGFVDPRWKVEMEAEAVIGSAAEPSPDGG